MSLDRSLKSRSTLERHRNVLTRAERIEQLKETGRWSEDSTAIGLPKVLHRKVVLSKKGKTKKLEETEQAATEETGKETT